MNAVSAMSESTSASLEAPEYPIEVQDVTKRFGARVAVDALSLRIGRGTTFGFIGLNGAGKTTTIRMLVGLLAPDAGAIRVAGVAVPLRRDQLKPRVGYVPDRPTVYAWMRVKEAIHFCRRLYPRFNELRVAELMELFELDANARVKDLSKGSGAKLSLLLAMAHDPDVLILDEPTSGLDPLVRDEFLEGVLAATAERGQTVLFSSHTLADVQRLADSVGLLHEGRLLLHNTVDELLERTKRIRAVLTEPNAPGDTPPSAIWQQVRGREWLVTVKDFSREQVEFIRSRPGVEQVDVIDMSLDDVFKDVVRGERETRGVTR